MQTVEARNERLRSASRLLVVIRLLTLLFFVAGLLMIGLSVPIASVVEALSTRIERFGFWAPLVFGLCYVAASLALIPSLFLMLTAGGVFGLLKGVIIVSLSSTAAATCAFLIARYFARPIVLRACARNPRFAAIDRAIGQEGWKVVALMRLSPVVPFTQQNYLHGVTSIRLLPYVVTSWVTMLPVTIVYVYLGSMAREGLIPAGEVSQPAGPLVWTFRVLGLVATVVVAAFFIRLARRALTNASIRGRELELAEQDQAQRIDLQKPPAEPRTGRWVILLLIAALVLIAGATSITHRTSVRSGLQSYLGVPPDVSPTSAEPASDRHKVRKEREEK